MRLPADNEAYAPEFPPNLQWVNVAFLRMAQQIGRPILVEFFDFAHPSIAAPSLPDAPLDLQQIVTCQVLDLNRRSVGF